MTIFRSPFGEIAPRAVTITERVFEGLALRPDSIAMIEGPTGRTVTAQALMDAIRGFAGALAARGFGPGDVVALMAPNCPEYAIAMHGALWAGCTVTTLNPSYTAEEAHRQLVDSDARMLVTTAAAMPVAHAAVAGTGVGEIVSIGAAEGATPFDSLTGPPLAAQVPVDLSQHIAVLPYSSGTTGLPKGVMLTHRNLVANVDQVMAVASIRPDETSPAFLPFFHIYGMQVAMNVYLAAGATPVTMPRFDLEQFLRLIETYRCRRLFIVPPVAVALAKHPIVDQFDLSSLEQVISGAAPLGGDVAEAVAARIGCAVMQAYGMTELSPVTHVTPLGAARAGSVGPTVPGTACRIVDSITGDDLGPGQEGELWISGPQVMKGYHRRPDATAETVDAEGWLRTGDIACFDADGYLYIRDRAKELIKVKGFAVAPAEIEAVLLTHPQIVDAAVIGVPDDEAGEVPMAFVVPAPGAALTLEQVQVHVAGHLATYKQVRRAQAIPAIPKSASGKILRRVLRQGAVEGGQELG